MADNASTNANPGVVLQPVRSQDYEMRAATGFLIRAVGDNTFLLDAFMDLPPIRRIRVEENGGEEAALVERKFITGFLLNRDEMIALGNRLLEAAGQTQPKAG